MSYASQNYGSPSDAETARIVRKRVIERLVEGGIARPAAALMAEASYRRVADRMEMEDKTPKPLLPGGRIIGR